jgi:hypothetical protein
MICPVVVAHEASGLTFRIEIESHRERRSDGALSGSGSGEGVEDIGNNIVSY